jgi:hypothetical protein
MAGDFFSSAPGFTGGGGSAPTNWSGAVSDLFSGFSQAAGSFASAEASATAAKQYFLAADVSKEQTALSERMAAIQLAQTQGAVQAGTAGAGFQMGGSAADIMRENAAQGALTKGAIDIQGNLQTSSYTAQMKAAKQTATGQKVSGGLSALGAVAAFALLL